MTTPVLINCFQIEKEIGAEIRIRLNILFQFTLLAGVQTGIIRRGNPTEQVFNQGTVFFLKGEREQSAVTAVKILNHIVIICVIRISFHNEAIAIRSKLAVAQYAVQIIDLLFHLLDAFRNFCQKIILKLFQSALAGKPDFFPVLR